MADEGRMAGKRAIVTGSGTGIGRGIAVEFAKEGAVVALHYSHSGKGAEEAVEEIRAAGGTAQAFQSDFSKVDEPEKLAEEAIDFLGGIDVLVNNAGITVNIPFGSVKVEQFDLLYSVNIRAMFFLTQAVAPTMEAQGGGAVINLSSVHAFAGMTEHSIYAGTKGAIVSYTRELSLELIQRGIRVNCLAPGWVAVENQRDALGPDFDWDEAAKGVPAGFVSNPTDMARICMFLASEDSRYIIGQTIIADGGQLAIMPMTGDFRQPRDDIQWGAPYVPNISR